MIITNVAWARDHQGRSVLDLKIDGHQAHIQCGQKAGLIRQGIVDGIVYFDSERPGLGPNPFVRGSYAPELSAADLVSCTDDPQVFALYEDMCRAIRSDTWRAGPREDPPEVRPVRRTGQLPVGPVPGDRGH